MSVIHETKQELGSITDLFPYEEDNDPNRKAHVVRPLENQHITEGQPMTGQSVVDIARMTSQHVVALCGYTWVPKYNPDSFDACEACLKIAERIMGES